MFFALDGESPPLEHVRSLGIIVSRSLVFLQFADKLSCRSLDLVGAEREPERHLFVLKTNERLL